MGDFNSEIITTGKFSIGSGFGPHRIQNRLLNDILCLRKQITQNHSVRRKSFTINMLSSVKLFAVFIT